MDGKPDSNLNRGRFGNALAPSVVQIDELFRLGKVADDVELAHRFLFCDYKGCFRSSKIFAFGDIFCPLTVAGEIFQLLRVFDEDVHEQAFYQVRPDNTHTIGDYIFNTRAKCRLPDEKLWVKDSVPVETRLVTSHNHTPSLINTGRRAFWSG
jgi:hypothetical protein